MGQKMSILRSECRFRSNLRRLGITMCSMHFVQTIVHFVKGILEKIENLVWTI
jgi:hypothetical protein